MWGALNRHLIINLISPQESPQNSWEVLKMTIKVIIFDIVVLYLDGRHLLDISSEYQINTIQSEPLLLFVNLLYKDLKVN